MISSALAPMQEAEQTLLPPSKSQAYVCIFEDALDQLSVLSDITPEQLKTDNKTISDKIKSILLEQRELTERNIQLQTEREAAKNSSNKTKFKDIHNGITEVQNQLAASTLALARLLKTHPSVAQNLLKIQQERSSLHSLLQKSIKELRELKCETLVSTVEEEYKKRNILQNTINRERDQQELFKDLQLELGVEKKLITDEINDRNQVIQQLKDTIQEINALTSSEQKYIKKEVKSHEASVKNSCAYKESQLVQKRAKIAAEINQEHRVHTSIMKFLADERAVLEFEIQEWMTKYEEDTECKTLELEQLKLKRTADLDKFEELVGAYEVLEKTVDDDKSVRALEQEEMRMVQRREVACVHIQKWYRKWKQAAAKAPAQKGKKAAKAKKGKK